MSMPKYQRIVYAAGQTIGTGTTATATATVFDLPVDSNGTTARAVILTPFNVAQPAFSVRLATNTTQSTATINDLPVTQPIALVTRGAKFIWVIAQVANTKFHVAPLEDA